VVFQSLHTIINRIENQDTWKTHQRFQRIHLHWPEIVGQVVAAKAVPSGIQQDVLVVAVCNAAWAQNLAFERQRILEKINAQFPDVCLKEIRFSTTQWHANRQPSRSAEHQVADPREDDNPDIVELWRSHPSQIPPQSPQSPQPSKRHLSVVPDAPETAFQQWAMQIQERAQRLPLCPQCQCPTPQGELDRWQRCGVCATKDWTSS
jgi:predicted nucleic acid-binding Zn ribbon protein